MERLYKSFLAKADEDGKIEGYFSTYGPPADSYGDIIAEGAFSETIKKREESGHPFPLCWNHDLDQIIGKIDKIEDTEKGPHIEASFFNTPLAQEKREIVKSGVVYQFSFAYAVEDWETKTIDGEKVTELKKIELFEISIVPIPANQNAVVTDIKGKKEGKRNSKADEGEIEKAIEEIDNAIERLEATKETLKALIGDKPDDEPKEPEDNPGGEDPTGADDELKGKIDELRKFIAEI